MRSLHEHNISLREYYKQVDDHEAKRRTSKLAGIVCDICRTTEMHYSYPQMINQTIPPTKWVFCPNEHCSAFELRKIKTV